MEGLSEEERRALRGSKFAPLPSRPSASSSSQPRQAHPGGSVITNKAAALAKFLERKLQKPGGLDSIDPDLLRLAVQNAKRTVLSSGTPNSRIRHVPSFGDSEDASEDGMMNGSEPEKPKKKKKKKKKKKNGSNSNNKKEKIVCQGQVTVKGAKKMKL